MASAPCGLGQKLLDPEAVPLLANQASHRGGGIRHLEGGTEGAGEGVAVARREVWGWWPLVEETGAVEAGLVAGAWGRAVD